VRHAAGAAAIAVLLGAAVPAALADEKGRTILAVFAHPDDEGLVAPLLASYAGKGVRVQLVIVTDGEKGTNAFAGIPAGPELARVRAEEVRCACRALGIEAPILLGFKDGELGAAARPPWAPLSRVRDEVAAVMQRIRPDVVVTFGPEGAYGHPDHRLVGAVVTQIVEAGGDGVPARLFYPGFPKDRLPPHGQNDIPWAPTDPRFLTVRVPYAAADLAKSRAALGCHKSQFRAEEMDPLTRFMDQVLGGKIYLRPWFGAGHGDDVFTPDVP
jgi:LmbE family N-acetylglucosaminyl deacetylase